MDHRLRCNVLKCRKELGDRALVTTCSHIFCIDCASRLGLTGQRHEHRNSCPACGAQLTNPDDAVISNLDPSEDYKTSVLSGLNPNIIIECANRGLSFWAYQVTQEVVYQEYLGKTLTEKYSDLSVHLDSTKADQDSLRRKYDELSQAYKEKNRKLLQVQELYDKLKRKAMLGQLQDAAEDAVDSTLHGAQFETGIQASVDYGDHEAIYQQQQHSLLQEQQRMPMGQKHQSATQDYGTSWPRTIGAQSNVPITPSSHRQRLGDPTTTGLSTIPGLVAGTPRVQHTSIVTRVPQSEGLANVSQFAQRPTPVSSTFSRRPAGGQPETMINGVRGGFTNL
ncbi:uncharacterized protein F4822DRAFT_434715 [Hypoxylon trugodes]|uniref:uncharacterized protein n=1 Tax=Hypoxylon trugodes TaxID=326681 RepID=UPI0021993E4C|nr:uncharacterized protein F4822DRAFT_434715 [Hypoxylon trugodes]KAI1383602.1 hypothetical protein F4822DRAFT_434715 [Hypoxylon trugodes]